MDNALWLSIAALIVGLAGLIWATWVWWRVRALGLGLGLRAGSLLNRLRTIGRRLEALEAGHVRQGEALGRCGLHSTVVHYAPVGLGGTRNCFVLALLNRVGDGVVLNVLTSGGVHANLKEVQAWQSQGQAFTAEEDTAVAANQKWWGE